MEYGCIGEKLSHSFSKEIHARLADYQYELKELERAEVPAFMSKADFKAINVTIPYKETVIPFLDEIDDAAKAIGAVNTVVKRDGRLYGYNTDFAGMSALLRKAGIALENKKVLILGSGGTSKTALAVAKAQNASDVLRVSRSSADDCITYEQAICEHSDAEVIINTTPVGMYPNINGAAIDLKYFKNLSGVADAVYNPLNSMLVQKARERGIPAEGGLYMLVMQAAYAVQHFIGEEISLEKCENCYQDILKLKKNIVLIGMPSSGKSTLGEKIAKELQMDFVDSDTEIVKQAGCSIPEIFAGKGEKYFRELETKVIEILSAKQHTVIATGGGAILKEENVRLLRANSTLIFIDRPLEQLITTDDRPLSNDRQKLERLFAERYEKYVTAADISVDCSKDIQTNVAKIIEEISK